MIPNMAEKEDNIKLFDSGEEEEEGDYEDDFRIRPQYEGPHGQEILEMNSELSKRFKLDERFAEDFDPKVSKGNEAENVSTENEEKMKNIRILETILGHEVRTKPVDKSFSRKRLIRFDPEDENASQFVKTTENTCEVAKKPKKKQKIEEKKVEDVVPISTERYIEVCPNLKEILSSSTPFSFSQKFNFDNKEEATADSEKETSPEAIEEIEHHKSEKKSENKVVTPTQKLSRGSFIPKSKYDTFFIVDGDPRLKEGIEFFKRPKPLEAIRVEWQKRRDNVLELFRRKRRSSQRSHTTRVQSVQMKNMIRKHNFKK